jgi:hypothetical protein
MSGSDAYSFLHRERPVLARFDICRDAAILPQLEEEPTLYGQDRSVEIDHAARPGGFFSLGKPRRMPVSFRAAILLLAFIALGLSSETNFSNRIFIHRLHENVYVLRTCDSNQPLTPETTAASTGGGGT